MAKVHELLNQLLTAGSIPEFRNFVDSMVISGNYEVAMVFTDYFHHSNIKKNRLYLVKSLRRFPDPKSRIKLLLDFVNDRDFDIKMEVLKSMQFLRNPVFTWRLMSTYKNTRHNNKKITVLMTLINTGISLFTDYFVEQFRHESRNVQYFILLYLANCPTVSDDMLDQLMPLADDIIKSPANVEESYYLLSNFFFINQRNPRLKKKFRKYFDPAHLREDGSGIIMSGLLYHFDTDIRYEGRKLNTKKIIDEFQREDATVQYILRYDRDAVGRLVIPVREKLIEYEKHYKKTMLSFIRNLIWLDSSDISSLFIEMINISDKFNFKQVLLENIIYFPLEDNQKENLELICVELLMDRKHIRIFDVLTRVMIVVFQHEGVKKIQEYFESIDDEEHKTAVLSGIISAVHDYGYGSVISSFDLYHFNLIIGNSLNFIKKSKLNGSLLVSRVFRLIALLNIGNYVDEMLDIIEESSPGTDALNALMNLNTEKTFQKINAILGVLKDNILGNSLQIRYIFDNICHRHTRFAQDLNPAVILTLLQHPLFTADIIRYLNTYDIRDHTSTVLKFTRSENLETRHNVLTYIEHLGTADYLEEIYHLFRKGDSFIKRQAALLLMNCPSPPHIKKILTWYLVNRKRSADVKYLLRHLGDYDKAVSVCFKELISFNKLKICSELKEEISDLAYRYFSTTSETPETMPAQEEPISRPVSPELNRLGELLPPEARRSLHTAEGFFNFLTREVVENKKNIDQFNFYSLTTEYTHIVLSVCSAMVLPALPVLFRNTDYLYALSNIFKNAYNYIEFLNRQKQWEDVHYDNRVIQVLIRLILEKKSPELKSCLGDLNEMIHLLFMVCHNTSHYSINNPMELPLDLLEKHHVITSLYRFYKLTGSLDELENDKVMPRIREIRDEIINLARFYEEYHGHRSGAAD